MTRRNVGSAAPAGSAPDSSTPDSSAPDSSAPHMPPLHGSPLDGIPLDDLRAAVLAWYDREARSLPFRGASDPWAILVSETMAQQTQAERAGQAWSAFIVRFPTPRALAEAEPADVLRAWRGLGYNRRAIALQRAAQRIVDLHDGRVPEELQQLEGLPGVGPYTARAVAALAFGRRVGAVDTNVRRVIARLCGAPLAPRDAQALADALVDHVRPGDWTHALMDVGARRCRPTAPRCDECPLARWCRDRGHGIARRETGEIAILVGDRAAAGIHGASRPPSPSAVRNAPSSRTPFPATTRWLRGRIVDRLRDAPRDAWVRLEGPMGVHGPSAVASAAAALVRDGLAESDPVDPVRLRLPSRAIGPSSGARASTSLPTGSSPPALAASPAPPHPPARTLDAR
jgi:A/G-specific adenine glycosylase